MIRAVQLIAGTCGAFYCQTCLRDDQLAGAGTEAGLDLQMVPLYLPLTAEDLDDADRAGTPRFFGGLNVYFQQVIPGWGRLPRRLTRWLDHPVLLRWAGRMASMTSASQLGSTTVSMLSGEHGRQRSELDALAAWLADEAKPQAVILSSALLLGLARTLRQRLGVPLLCWLQDEDGFLDGLGEPWSAQAWALLRGRLTDADRFLAPTEDYRARMAARLGLDPARIGVVRPGLDLAGYTAAESPPPVPTVGFLSPALPEKGLLELVEAVGALRDRLPGLRLSALGGETAGSPPYVKQVRRRVRALGLEAQVDLLGNPGRPRRQAWLRTLSCLCVPEQHPEAAGLYVLEAAASGVPCVVPRLGGVAELTGLLGNAVTYDPADAAALPAALSRLLGDTTLARDLAAAGRIAAARDFSAGRAAADLAREIAATLPG